MLQVVFEQRDRAADQAAVCNDLDMSLDSFWLHKQTETVGESLIFVSFQMLYQMSINVVF